MTWRLKKRIHKAVCQLVITSYILSFVCPLRALAAPVGGSVASGQATFQTANGTLTITQLTDKVILNWQSFNIGANEAVRFFQPSTLAAALNRVTGVDPSVILGSLTANGRIFLVNPNGILFGNGARIDVGGLVASTLQINNSDFLNGTYKFFQDPAHALGAAVVNQGTITAHDHGFVVLVAPLVSNEGTIVANLGQVQLAAGNQALVTLDPQGLVKVSLPTVTGPHGDVQLDANAASDVIKSVVNSGLVEAGQVVAKPCGQVLLQGAAGVAINSGSIQVNGASNADAGSIGIQSTQTTVTTGSSVLQANGQGINSSGGSVSVLSQGRTWFAGKIEAKGGDTGNGGTVETSGHVLNFRGNVDTSAPGGHVGSLLLDPNCIKVIHGAAGGGCFCGHLPCATANCGAGNVTITDGAINAQCANVTLTGGNGVLICNCSGCVHIKMKANKSLTLKGGTGGVNDGATGFDSIALDCVCACSTGFFKVTATGPITFAHTTISTAKGTICLQATGTGGGICLGNGGFTTIKTTKSGCVNLKTCKACHTICAATAKVQACGTGSIVISAAGAAKVGVVKTNSGFICITARSGNITTTGAITAGGTGTVGLNASGGVSQTGGAITASNLDVKAAGGCGVCLTKCNAVSNFAAKLCGCAKALRFTDKSALTISCVDGLAGIATKNGNVTLTTKCLHGITVRKPISTGGTAAGTVLLCSAGSVTQGCTGIACHCGKITARCITIKAGGTGVLCLCAQLCASPCAGTITLRTNNGNLITGQTGTGRSFCISAGGCGGVCLFGVVNGCGANGTVIVKSNNGSVHTLAQLTGKCITLCAKGTGKNVLACQPLVGSNTAGTVKLSAACGSVTTATSGTITGKTLCINAGGCGHNITLGKTVTSAGTATLKTKKGTITAAACNQLTTVTATVTCGSKCITVKNAQALTLCAVTDAGGTLKAVTTSGGITVNGAVNVGTGKVALLSKAGICQGAGGAITALGLLTTTCAGAVSLSSATSSVCALIAKVGGNGNALSFKNGKRLTLGNTTCPTCICGVNTTNGSVTLTTTVGAICIGKGICAGTGTVTLNAAAGVTEPCKVITAQSLLVSSTACGVTLIQTNHVCNVAAKLCGCGKAFSFKDTRALTVACVGSQPGIATKNGSVTLTGPCAGVTLTKGILAGTGCVSILAHGAVSGAGGITSKCLIVHQCSGNPVGICLSGAVASSNVACFFVFGCAGAIKVNGACADFNVVKASALANITLNDKNGVTLCTITTRARNCASICVTAHGNVIQLGALSASGTNGSVTVGTTGKICVCNNVTANATSGAIHLTGCGAVKAGAFTLSAHCISLQSKTSSLCLNSAHLVAPGTLCLQAQTTITATSTCNDFGTVKAKSGGNICLVDGGTGDTLALGNICANNGAGSVCIQANDTITSACGTGIKANILTLSTKGTCGTHIALCGTVTSSGVASFKSTKGSITAANAGNDFSTVTVPCAAGGNVTLRDKNGLALCVVNAGANTVKVTAKCNITQCGVMTAGKLLVVDSCGSVTLRKCNHVGTVAACLKGANQGLTFKNAQTLTVGGVCGTCGITTTTGNVTLTTTTGFITISKPIKTEPTTVFLCAHCGINGFCAITACNLVAHAGTGNILLEACNKVTNLAAKLCTAGRCLLFKNTQATCIHTVSVCKCGTPTCFVGICNPNGPVTLHVTSGNLTQTSAIKATKLNLRAETGAITLCNNGNAVGTLVSRQCGLNQGISFKNSAGLSVGSACCLTSLGTHHGISTNAGNVTLGTTSGGITLLNCDPIAATCATVTLTTTCGAVASNNAGAKICAKQLCVSAGGLCKNITLAGTVTSTGTATLKAGKTITACNACNAFTTLVACSNTAASVCAGFGNITVVNKGAITLGAISDRCAKCSTVKVTAGGTITECGPIAAKGCGNTICLKATAGNVTVTGALCTKANNNGTVNLKACAGSVTGAGAVTTKCLNVCAVGATHVVCLSGKLSVGGTATLKAGKTITASKACNAIHALVACSDVVGVACAGFGNITVVNGGAIVLCGISDHCAKCSKVKVTAAGTITECGSIAAKGCGDTICLKATAGGITLTGALCTRANGTINLKACAGSVTGGGAVTTRILNVCALGAGHCINLSGKLCLTLARLKAGKTITACKATNAIGNLAACSNLAGNTTCAGFGNITVVNGGAICLCGISDHCAKVSTVKVTAGAIMVSACGGIAAKGCGDTICLKATVGNVTINSNLCTKANNNGTIDLKACAGSVTGGGAVTTKCLNVCALGATHVVCLTGKLCVGGTATLKAGKTITACNACNVIHTLVACSNLAAAACAGFGNITVVNGGAITLGAISDRCAKCSTVKVTAGGTITECGPIAAKGCGNTICLKATAGNLTVTGALCTKANNNGTVNLKACAGSVTGAGAVTTKCLNVCALGAGHCVNLTGKLSVGGTATLKAGKTITANKACNAISKLVACSNLAGAVCAGFGNVTVVNGGAITLGATNDHGAKGSTMKVTAAGTITECGPITATGCTICMNATTGCILVNGNLCTPAATGTVNLKACAGSVTGAGNITGHTLTVCALGAGHVINLTGKLSVGGTSTFTTTSGNISATDACNALGTVKATVNCGSKSVTLKNKQALTLCAVSDAGGTLQVCAQGTIAGGKAVTVKNLTLSTLGTCGANINLTGTVTSTCLACLAATKGTITVNATCTDLGKVKASAGGNITLNDKNGITLCTSTTNGTACAGLCVKAHGNVCVKGALCATGSKGFVTVCTTGGIAVCSNITANACNGTISLAACSNITFGAGTLSARCISLNSKAQALCLNGSKLIVPGTLCLKSAGAISATNACNDFAAVKATSGGNICLVDSGTSDTLTLDNICAKNGVSNVCIQANGAITSPTCAQIKANNLTLSTKGAAAGNIALCGKVTSAGLASFNATGGSITAANACNDFNRVTVPCCAGGNVTLRDKNALRLCTIKAGANTVKVTAKCGISESGPMTAGSLLILDTCGSATLCQCNHVGTLAAQLCTSFASISFKNAQALTIGAVGGVCGVNTRIACPLRLTTTAGGITLCRHIVTCACGQGGVVLCSAQGVTENAGGTICTGYLIVRAKSGCVAMNQANGTSFLGAKLCGTGKTIVFRNRRGFSVDCCANGIKGITTTKGCVSLTTTAGGIGLGQAVTASCAPLGVRLCSAAGVSQCACGIVTAPGLLVRVASGSVSLAGATNSVCTLVAKLCGSGGTLRFKNGKALQIGAACCPVIHGVATNKGSVTICTTAGGITLLNCDPITAKCATTTLTTTCGDVASNNAAAKICTKTLNITAGGGHKICLKGTVTAGGTSTLHAAGGAVCATNCCNDFGTVTTTSSGNTKIFDKNAITLDTMSVTGNCAVLQVQANGTVTAAQALCANGTCSAIALRSINGGCVAANAALHANGTKGVVGLIACKGSITATATGITASGACGKICLVLGAGATGKSIALGTSNLTTSKTTGTVTFNANNAACTTICQGTTPACGKLCGLVTAHGVTFKCVTGTKILNANLCAPTLSSVTAPAMKLNDSVGGCFTLANSLKATAGNLLFNNVGHCNCATKLTIGANLCDTGGNLVVSSGVNPAKLNCTTPPGLRSGSIVVGGFTVHNHTAAGTNGNVVLVANGGITTNAGSQILTDDESNNCHTGGDIVLNSVGTGAMCINGLLRSGALHCVGGKCVAGRGAITLQTFSGNIGGSGTIQADTPNCAGQTNGGTLIYRAGVKCGAPPFGSCFNVAKTLTLKVANIGTGSGAHSASLCFTCPVTLGSACIAANYCVTSSYNSGSDGRAALTFDGTVKAGGAIHATASNANGSIVLCTTGKLQSTGGAIAIQAGTNAASGANSGNFTLKNGASLQTCSATAGCITICAGHNVGICSTIQSGKNLAVGAKNAGATCTRITLGPTACIHATGAVCLTARDFIKACAGAKVQSGTGIKLHTTSISHNGVTTQCLKGTFTDFCETACSGCIVNAATITACPGCINVTAKDGNVTLSGILTATNGTFSAQTRAAGCGGSGVNHFFRATNAGNNIQNVSANATGKVGAGACTQGVFYQQGAHPLKLGTVTVAHAAGCATNRGGITVRSCGPVTVNGAETADTGIAIQTGNHAGCGITVNGALCAKGGAICLIAGTGTGSGITVGATVNGKGGAVTLKTQGVCSSITLNSSVTGACGAAVNLLACGTGSNVSGAGQVSTSTGHLTANANNGIICLKTNACTFTANTTGTVTDASAGTTHLCQVGIGKTPSAVTVTACGSVLGKCNAVDLKAGKATLTAQGAGVTVGAAGKPLGVNISGTGANGLKATAGGGIFINSPCAALTLSGLTATGVAANACGIVVTSTGAVSDLNLGVVNAVDTTGKASLNAGRDIINTSGQNAAAEATAQTLTLTANGRCGFIGPCSCLFNPLDVAVSGTGANGLTATANGARGFICILSPGKSLTVTAASATGAAPCLAGVVISTTGAGSDLLLASVNSVNTTGVASLRAGRSILNASCQHAAAEVTAARATLTAGTCVGTVGTLANAVDVNVSGIGANGLKAVANGACGLIHVNSPGQSLTLSGLSATGAAAGACAVVVSTTGACSNLNLGVVNAVNTTGKAVLTAGQSLLNTSCQHAAAEITAASATLTANGTNAGACGTVGTRGGTDNVDVRISGTGANGLKINANAAKGGYWIGSPCASLTLSGANATGAPACTVAAVVSTTGACSQLNLGTVNAVDTTGKAILTTGQSLLNTSCQHAAAEITAASATLTASGTNAGACGTVGTRGGTDNVDVRISGTGANGLKVNANAAKGGFWIGSPCASLTLSGASATGAAACTVAAVVSTTGACSNLNLGTVNAVNTTGKAILTAGQSLLNTSCQHAAAEITAASATLTANGTKAGACGTVGTRGGTDNVDVRISGTGANGLKVNANAAKGGFWIGSPCASLTLSGANATGSPACMVAAVASTTGACSNLALGTVNAVNTTGKAILTAGQSLLNTSCQHAAAEITAASATLTANGTNAGACGTVGTRGGTDNVDVRISGTGANGLKVNANAAKGGFWIGSPCASLTLSGANATGSPACTVAAVVSTTGACSNLNLGTVNAVNTTGKAILTAGQSLLNTSCQHAAAEITAASATLTANGTNAGACGTVGTRGGTDNVDVRISGTGANGLKVNANAAKGGFWIGSPCASLTLSGANATGSPACTVAAVASTTGACSNLNLGIVNAVNTTGKAILTAGQSLLNTSCQHAAAEITAASATLTANGTNAGACGTVGTRGGTDNVDVRISGTGANGLKINANAAKGGFWIGSPCASLTLSGANATGSPACKVAAVVVTTGACSDLNLGAVGAVNTTGKTILTAGRSIANTSGQHAASELKAATARLTAGGGSIGAAGNVLDVCVSGSGACGLTATANGGAAGVIQVSSAAPLTLSAVTNAAGTSCNAVAVTTTGCGSTLTVAGAVCAPNGTVSLTAERGASVTGGGAVTAKCLSVAAASMSGTGCINLSGVITSEPGIATLTANGSITAANLCNDFCIIVTAGGTTLVNNGDALTVRSARSTTAGSCITFNAAQKGSGNLTVTNGITNPGGTVRLTTKQGGCVTGCGFVTAKSLCATASSGGVTLGGKLCVTGATTLTASGAVSAANAGNDFNTICVNAGSDVTVADANCLVVNQISSSGGKVAVTTGGSQLLHSISAAGSVCLSARGSILDATCGATTNVRAGASSAFRACGVVGRFHDPLSVDINGALGVSAASQLCGVSVDIAGFTAPNTLSVLNAPPGLVIFNGRILGGGAGTLNQFQSGIQGAANPFSNFSLTDFFAALQSAGFVADEDQLLTGFPTFTMQLLLRPVDLETIEPHYLPVVGNGHKKKR